MSDTEFYGWDHTRTYHDIWLNQLEKGTCTWHDQAEKHRFCQALVWHPVLSSPCTTSTARPVDSRRQHRPPAKFNTPAKPVTKASKAYNDTR